MSAKKDNTSTRKMLRSFHCFRERFGFRRYVLLEGGLVFRWVLGWSVVMLLSVGIVGGEVLAQNAACPERESPVRTRHLVNADVNYPARTVDVQQTISYVNQTGVVQRDLLLNVDPNRWFDTFRLEVVGGVGGLPEWELEGKRLLVTLNEPLAPNCETWLMLEFRLNVPLIGDRVYAPDGYLGYTPRQLNLGHWLPTVAVWQDGDWVSRESSFVGEQEVLEQADWDVTIRLTGVNAGDAPVIAAPGTVSQLGLTTWRYTLDAARDFPLSMSDAYRKSIQTLENGQVAELYTFENAWVHTNRDGVAAPVFALDMAAKSLEMFADLFGAYPYERLIIVQADFPDGMEFSGLIFVGGSWFTSWSGGVESYLALITVHEVAHQWWYLQVGNDTALSPWLDEALATYSEYIFLEEFYPELRDWWWGFRVDSFYPEGFVDSNIYEFDNARLYINAVYLRGVQMMHDLRDDLGTEAFFQWLADYAAVANGTIATPGLFWSLLTPAQFEATAATRAVYFRDPQGVPAPLSTETE